jgi:cellulose/xylan binding protein with CBM9 domain
MRIWTALVCLLAAACVEKETDKVDDGFIKDNLLSAAPTPKYPVNADFGGKVVYLGADLDRETAAIGDRVRVTHYWKVIEPPGAEWRLFTHVNGSSGDWINVDDTRMRKMHGPDRWRAGEIIRDEQVFPILKTWKSPDAVIYVGMFRKGGQTERDRMAIKSGPTDGKSRLKVATVKITGAAPAAKPEEPKPYVVRKAAGAVKIDGKDDDADWAKAEATGPFVDAEGGEPVGQDTRARLLWDDKNLYVFFDVADKDIVATMVKHDDPLWKEDAVELFIDADKNGKGYVELQASPKGTTFDSWFPTVRGAKDESPKWDSGMKAAATRDAKGWRVELAIPLAAVKGGDDKMAVKIPPAVGDSWKLNLVRVDKSKTGPVRAAAWAKIPISDFHAIDRLRPVVFGDAQGKATAAAAPAPAPAPAAQK